VTTLPPSLLVNLDQSHRAMDRDGLQTLIKHLSDLPTVETIDLSHNNLNDESSDELARLVTLDKGSSALTLNPITTGFNCLDLSFNDLGARAVEKIFKFGVAYNFLTTLCLEGNLDCGLEPGVGEFLAGIIKGGVGKTGSGKRGKRTTVTRKAGKGAVGGVRAPPTKKLSTLRLTLFDYTVVVKDQNSGVSVGGAKKGKKSSTSRRAPSRTKKGAREPLSRGNPALTGPMNALTFVRAMFGAPVKAVGAKNGAARRPVRGMTKKKVSEGVRE